MSSLIIGAVGLFLVLAGLLTLMVRAAGEDAGAMLAIVLASVAVTAIVVFFAVQLGIGLEEVFFLRE